MCVIAWWLNFSVLCTVRGAEIHYCRENKGKIPKQFGCEVVQICWTQTEYEKKSLWLFVDQLEHTLPTFCNLLLHDSLHMDTGVFVYFTLYPLHFHHEAEKDMATQ